MSKRSNLEPVKKEPKPKILDVRGMTRDEWDMGSQINISIQRGESIWVANLFRFTDDEGHAHSVLFVGDVPPEDL